MLGKYAWVTIFIFNIILALHPICKHFHSGSILSTNSTHLILKFFRQEYGVHKISYTNISMDVCPKDY